MKFLIHSIICALALVCSNSLRVSGQVFGEFGFFFGTGDWHYDCCIPVVHPHYYLITTELWAGRAISPAYDSIDVSTNAGGKPPAYSYTSNTPTNVVGNNPAYSYTSNIPTNVVGNTPEYLGASPIPKATIQNPTYTLVQSGATLPVKLEILFFPPTRGMVVLAKGFSGRYVLETSTNVSGSWYPVADFVIGASQQVFIEVHGSTRQQFFRVRN